MLNYDELRAYMATVPAPWLLKPRTSASALGIRKIHEPEQLWRALDELGDRQSHFILEHFVPGEIFHVDSIVSEGKVVFSAVHQYGRPPMQVMHEGGVFTTRTVDRAGSDWKELTAFNAALAPATGLGARRHACRVHQGARRRASSISSRSRRGSAGPSSPTWCEASTGMNLWREWARIESGEPARRGVRACRPSRRSTPEACCASRKPPSPIRAAFNAPEIVHRMKKHHHAGLIVRSDRAERVAELLEDYSAQFAQMFLASMPPPEKPTA